MKRLGYAQFVASGGDWGDPVTEQMAVFAPATVRGIHLNMPSAVPAEIFKALQGGPLPMGLAPDEKHAFDQLDFFFKYGTGYAQEMNRRRRFMRLKIRPSDWRHGYLTMTWVVTNSSRAFSMERLKDSRAMISLITSRSIG